MTWLAIVALAWDGEFLYAARAGGVDVYRDGRLVRTLDDGPRTAVCLAARGGRLAEGGGRAGERGELRLWEGGRLLWKLEIHADLVYGVAWSGDGRTLYTAGADRTIGIVDTASGTQTGRLEGHAGPVLAVAAHGGLLASGGADGTIRLWEGGRLLRSISNHAGAVHALAFSEDGETLASGSADRSVRVWKPRIGRLMKIVRGHDGTVTGLAWQGERLWSACADGKGRRLDVGAAAVAQVVERGADWLHAVCPAGGRVWFAPAEGALFPD